MGSEAIKIILRKCELFSDLSDQELSSIAELGRIEEYEAGGLIYIGETCFNHEGAVRKLLRGYGNFVGSIK